MDAISRKRTLRLLSNGLYVITSPAAGGLRKPLGLRRLTGFPE